jgi:hypothetical protein
LAFLIREIEMSFRAMEDFFGKQKAEEVKTTGWGKIREFFTGTEKVRKATFIVKEIWTNEYRCYVTGTKVLRKERNPYFDFKNIDKNYFLSPGKPFIVKSLFQTDESLIGDTDYVSQTMPMQDNLNKRKRQIENISGKVANPALCIDSSVMSKEEAMQQTNEEGTIFYGNGAADPTKIRFAEPGNVPQYLFQDLETTQNIFDNIWGTHSTTRGEREGRETLGGRQLLRQADLGRIDLVARQVERAMDEIAEWWTQLIKMFYTDKRSIKVLGDEGVRFVKDFSGDKVGGVRLIVKPGSTLPRDEVTIHQEALLLWQNKGIGLKTFYKMLKLPNVEAAIQDFQETFGGGQKPAQPVPLGLPGESTGQPMSPQI